jgi:methionyl-tRNA formyltransferase
MRILFAGTPAIAVAALEALAYLHAEGGVCELAGILTNPDTVKGRRGSPAPSDIGSAAERLRCGVSPVLLKSETIDEACMREAASLRADILVSFAYGAIFPDEFLALFPLGGINVHPSLLPKYRGATPIQAAILNRDSETGISIQQLTGELDSGGVLAQEIIPLTGRETTASLSVTIAEKSAALLLRTLKGIAAGEVNETPQNHGAATYCDKLKREDGRINWRQSALEIDARIRAFTPWPLSYTKHGDAELYILEAAPYNGAFTGGGTETAGKVLGADKNAGIIIRTGGGLLAVSRLQYRTRKALDWKAFLNGARNFTGAVLE